MKNITEIMQDQIEMANPMVLDGEFDEMGIEFSVQYCQYQDNDMGDVA